MKKILSVLLITFLFPLNSFAGLELEDLKGRDKLPNDIKIVSLVKY